MARSSRSHTKLSLSPKAFFVVILVIFILVSILFSVFQLFPSIQTNTLSKNLQQEINRLWQEKEYESLIEIAALKLEQEPLDLEFLFLRGAAYYYSAQNESNFEQQLLYFNNAIIDLRRSLLMPSNHLHEEIHYLLGKAYYHKGYYFYDSAHFHLQQAELLGYHQADSFEYLGLVSAELGNVEEGIQYLDSSYSENGRAIILLTIARLYSSLEDYNASLSYSSRAFKESTDSFEQEQALLITGAAYRALSNWSEAESAYRQLFELNPMSADAKFYLGEVFAAKGDYVQARVYWRDAFSINPSHPGAISRLNS